MGGGLTAVGHQRPLFPVQLFPVHDVTFGSVVDVETGTKLRTPFNESSAVSPSNFDIYFETT